MLKRSLAKNVSPAASAPPPPGQDRQRRSICDGLPRLVDAVRLATPWPDLSAGRRHPRRVAMGALKRTHGTMRWRQGPHRYHGPLPSSRSTIPPRTFLPVWSMAPIKGSRLLKWLPTSPVNFWQIPKFWSILGFVHLAALTDDAIKWIDQSRRDDVSSAAGRNLNSRRRCRL